ncbi:MAG: SagB/ThcOx family dehydrogenase [Egibacteraceae bacterium]
MNPADLPRIPADSNGGEALDLLGLVSGLSDHELAALRRFLENADIRALACSTSSLEQAQALTNWLNSTAADRSIELPFAHYGLHTPTEPKDVELPRDVPDIGLGLGEALRARRSGQQYASRPLALQSLSALLLYAAGIVRHAERCGRPDYPCSAAPAAGGLPSVAVFLVVCKAEALPPGVYAYKRKAHVLRAVLVGDPRPVLCHAYVWSKFADAPVTVVLAIRPRLSFRKYPLRHYRTLHIDVGVMAQNLYLVSTALGLSCCAVAGYRDDPIGQLISHSRDVVLPALLFAVGHTPQGAT